MFFAGLVCIFSTPAAAQTLRYTRKPNAKNGKALYFNGCVACHGADGRGAPMTSTEFKRPETFPDFTRCDQTAPEPNSNWKSIIIHGGPARGFSTIMPAFGDLFTNNQVDDLIAYLRGYCKVSNWPRGELNLPRALVTEKAYPENELVVSTAVNASGAPGLTTDFIHEQSFGSRGQLEVDVPWDYQDIDHNWDSHVGDITFGWKQVIFSSLRTGSILSLQGGILPPSGSQKLGGAGTTVFEPFAAFDQLFPTNTWVQFQMGADLPRHTDISPQSLYWNTAIGQTIAGDHRLGRQWSPMVEFLGSRDLVDGAKTDWDVLPEMQVTLSRRQHVRADIGVRTPMNNTSDRSPQVYFYVLWDWADGKLWKGWK
ncbi:MAG TPA: cytochrome c [Terracidiphilus sp.]|nr:cytochrome c [Terracidiphilus sp.]